MFKAFDKSMAEALNSRVKTRYNFKVIINCLLVKKSSKFDLKIGKAQHLQVL